MAVLRTILTYHLLATCVLACIPLADELGDQESGSCAEYRDTCGGDVDSRMADETIVDDGGDEDEDFLASRRQGLIAFAPACHINQLATLAGSLCTPDGPFHPPRATA